MPHENPDDDVWTTPEEWQAYLDDGGDGCPVTWNDFARIFREVPQTDGWCMFDQLAARKFWPESAA